MSKTTPAPDGAADALTLVAAELRDTAASQRETAAALAHGLSTLTALTDAVTRLLRDLHDLARAQRVFLDPPAALAARLSNTPNGTEAVDA